MVALFVVATAMTSANPKILRRRLAGSARYKLKADARAVDQVGVSGFLYRVDVDEHVGTDHPLV
jgi:hypothetical protein